MSNLFVKYTGILAIICGVSVGLVAAANEGTKDTIAKKHQADVLAAYKVVLPDVGDLKKLQAPGGMITDVQESSKSGKVNGYIYTVTPSGYGGKITLMVGISKEKNELTGIKVMSHSETPGLGAKSTEPEWQAQFKGKPLKDVLVVTKQTPTKKNEVKAITAATITSRGVVSGLNAVREDYMKNHAK
jgi:electron transport complex protein RnfG